jgi:hypothetical protein
MKKLETELEISAAAKKDLKHARFKHDERLKAVRESELTQVELTQEIYVL